MKDPMKFETKHYAVIGGLLIALGTQCAGVGSWHDMTTPTFVGGCLIQIGTTVAALFVGSPTANKED